MVEMEMMGMAAMVEMEATVEMVEMAAMAVMVEMEVVEEMAATVEMEAVVVIVEMEAMEALEEIVTATMDRMEMVTLTRMITMEVQMVIGSPAHISSTTQTKLFFELLKLLLCMEHNYLAADCSQQEWPALLVLVLLFLPTKDFSLIKTPSQELHRVWSRHQVIQNGRPRDPLDGASLKCVQTYINCNSNPKKLIFYFPGCSMYIKSKLC